MCANIYMSVCICVVWLWVYVLFMHICMCVCMYLNMSTSIWGVYIDAYIRMYVVCVCTFVYACIYVWYVWYVYVCGVYINAYLCMFCCIYVHFWVHRSTFGFIWSSFPTDFCRHFQQYLKFTNLVCSESSSPEDPLLHSLQMHIITLLQIGSWSQFFAKSTQKKKMHSWNTKMKDQRSPTTAWQLDKSLS